MRGGQQELTQDVRLADPFRTGQQDGERRPTDHGRGAAPAAGATTADLPTQPGAVAFTAVRRAHDETLRRDLEAADPTQTAARDFVERTALELTEERCLHPGQVPERRLR